MGKEKIEAIEVIGGCDVGSKKYKMRSFDNQGAFTEMEAHIDENWCVAHRWCKYAIKALQTKSKKT